MNKFKIVFFSVLALMILSVSAFAQGGGIQANPDTVLAYKAIGAGLGFGIAAGLGALGQGKTAASALEGIARNPAASDKVFTPMIIGLALIESLVLYAFVIAFLKMH